MKTTPNQDFILYLLANLPLKTNRVLEIVSLATYRDQESILRIMSYLTGFSEGPEIPAHPTNKKWNRGDNAQFVSYDILGNKVLYKYLQSKEFKVSDSYVSNDGHTFDDYYEIPRDIRSGKNEGQPITIKWWTTDSVSLQEWI